jgi:hypothetical protein
MAVGGDADAKAGNPAVAVVIDAVPLGGHCQFGRGVGRPSDFSRLIVAVSTPLFDVSGSVQMIA